MASILGNGVIRESNVISTHRNSCVFPWSSLDLHRLQHGKIGLMKFTPDNCITCGTILRADYFSPCIDAVRTDGQLSWGPYWFCSDACVKEALQTFMDKRFHFDRDYEDDPNIPDHHIEEWVEEWQAERRLAILQATAKLLNRALTAKKEL